LTDPKKDWRETDAGRFFQKNKVVIIACAAIALALNFAGGDGTSGTNGHPGGGGSGGGVQADGGYGSSGGGSGGSIPIDGGISGGGGSGGMTQEEWQRGQDREKNSVDGFIAEMIREEQTCPNGDVIAAHSTCPSE